MAELEREPRAGCAVAFVKMLVRELDKCNIYLPSNVASYQGPCPALNEYCNTRT